MTWLLILQLRAVCFCDTIDAPKKACFDQVLECFLDDDQDYCEEYFWSYYNGK